MPYPSEELRQISQTPRVNARDSMWKTLNSVLGKILYSYSPCFTDILLQGEMHNLSSEYEANARREFCEFRMQPTKLLIL
jgi:hypothetical protein